MRPSLGVTMRAHVADYLRGHLALREFDEWFVVATWSVERDGDRQAIDRMDEITLRLAEYSDGDCTEAELKRVLRHFTTAIPNHRAST